MTTASGVNEFDDLTLAAVREEVFTKVRGKFRGSLNEHDCEELAQEAITALVLYPEPIDDPKAFAVRTGFCDAFDRLRHSERRNAALELVGEPSDDSSDPAARFESEVELRRVRIALRQLPEIEREIYRERVLGGVSPRVIAARYGLAERTVQAVVKRVVDQVSEVRASEPFPRRLEALLREYIAKLGAFRRRREVERAIKRIARSDPSEAARLRKLHEDVISLVSGDPVARARLEYLQSLHERAAALIPPAAGFQHLGDPASVGERVAAGLTRLRHALPGGDSDAAGSAITGGGLRGAGGAGGALGGGIGGAFGLGGAAKVALGCLAGGAATAACVTALGPGLPLTGLGGSDRSDKPPAVERTAGHASKQSSPAADAAPILPSQVGNEAPQAPPETQSAPPPKDQSSPGQDPAATENTAPAAPAPAEETPDSDFGFGAARSSGTSTTSTSTNTSSSSTSSGGAGGGSGGGSASQGGDFAFGG
jgi:RNA polymerase sigma factor (sigma-70 family)